MADDAEKAVDTYQLYLDDAIAAQKRRAAAVQQATSEYTGECDLCGYDKPRLVETQFRNAKVYACAKCRDDYKLK